MRYFPLEINSIDQLKTIYKVLSKQHHPDKGGDAQKFIEMKSEYDYLLKAFEYGHDEESNKDLIDELEKARIEHDYKKGWVFFTFMGMAKEAKHSDFIYMAEVLGYAKGWAYYKWKEYEEQ